MRKNAYYIHLCQTWAAEYAAAPRQPRGSGVQRGAPLPTEDVANKRGIAIRVVRAVQERGGRFLKRAEGKGEQEWQVLDDDEAVSFARRGMALIRPRPVRLLLV